MSAPAPDLLMQHQQHSGAPHRSGERIYCDVYPSMEASVNDIWSTLNFSDHVANMLGHYCSQTRNYFSRGTTQPRRHDLAAPLGNPVGIGVVLERDDSGAHRVKSVAPHKPAQLAGLQPGDLVLQVDGMAVRGLGQELTDLIMGPPNTVVQPRPVPSAAAGPPAPPTWPAPPLHCADVRRSSCRQVELLIERNGATLPPLSIRRDAPPVDARSLFTRMSKPYEEVPFYLSVEDRADAIREAELRVAAIREKVYFEAGLLGGGLPPMPAASSTAPATEPAPAPEPEESIDEDVSYGTLI